MQSHLTSGERCALKKKEKKETRLRHLHGSQVQAYSRYMEKLQLVSEEPAARWPRAYLIGTHHKQQIRANNTQVHTGTNSLNY